MRKILISSMIGNALEWYDFVLYVQFSSIISNLFFPSDNAFTSLLATFGVFAVGFIMRPIGGIIFGIIGDKFGRKSALVFSILMMAIPTAFIGFLPTYEQIGIIAPIALTLIRLMQGIALGGGFSGCMTFIVEHADSRQRGVVGSTSMFSLGAGVLLGIIVSLGVSKFLSPENFISWGWRLPFIVSLGIGMIAFYIKNNIDESPIYLKAKEHGNLSKTPIHEVIFGHWKDLIVAISMYLTTTVPFYSFTAFFSTFCQHHSNMSLHEALFINGLSLIGFMFVMPLSGWLSDKIGRKKVMIGSAILIGIVTFPVFKLMLMGGFIYPLIGQSIFGIALGCYMGPVPAALVELFPTSIRFTGLALSYNVSAALFGGTAPFVYLFLIKFTGSIFAPAFYIIAFVIITIIILTRYKDPYKKELAER
jgi:MFS transporter, MHS family, proline/betaine transporter